MFTLVLQSLSKSNPCTLLLSSFSVKIRWLVLLPQHCCNCLTTDLIASVFVSNSQGTLKTRLVSQFFLNCTPQHMAFAMTKVLSKHSNDSSLSFTYALCHFWSPVLLISCSKIALTWRAASACTVSLETDSTHSHSLGKVFQVKTPPTYCLTSNSLHHPSQTLSSQQVENIL